MRGLNAFGQCCILHPYADVPKLLIIWRFSFEFGPHKSAEFRLAFIEEAIPTTDSGQLLYCTTVSNEGWSNDTYLFL